VPVVIGGGGAGADEDESAESADAEAAVVDAALRAENRTAVGGLDAALETVEFAVGAKVRVGDDLGGVGRREECEFNPRNNLVMFERQYTYVTRV
jgi:hypothetical protein